jgi:site-specific DNA-methyltransferase (adenine-specific)
MVPRAQRAPSIRIWPEDCVSGLRRRVRSGSASVIVTSPPYNLGKKYATYNDDRPSKDYLSWMNEVAASCRAALADQGSFFLNVGNKPSDPWWPFEVANTVRNAGFQLQNTILWVKSIAISQSEMGDYPHIQGDLAVGHYKPVNSRRYLNGVSEYIFHFTKHGDVELDKLEIGVPYQDKSNVGRWGDSAVDRRDRGNVWFIPYDTVRTSRAHPCIFPEKLPDMCIRLHGVGRTSLVIDPFLGTGTTALASDELGIACVGFEIDSKYVKIARESLRLRRLERAERRVANPSRDSAQPAPVARDIPR